MTVKFYKVGGCVRDSFLGIKSKDIDYAVEAPSYEEMKQAILDRGGKIFVEQPQYFTIRAKLNKEDADFVLCRKERGYADGRRPDSVEIGTLYDDLSRRDFSCNSLAIDEDGNLIDHFNGVEDIKNKIIKCVGDPSDRFREDSLRMLRAIRFGVTKDFILHRSVMMCFYNPNLIELIKNVSSERIREELFKCFKHDTLKTLEYISFYKSFFEYVFDKNNFGIWLKPTNEE